jgi:prepilin peptidase CpaA
MEQLGPFAFACGLLGGVYDLLTRRIPNWITFGGAGLGLIVQIYYGGFPGALHSLLGMLVALLLFLPIHVFGYMGAGDVKLLMAVGAWLNGIQILYVALGSILVGAAYALVEIIIRRRFLAVVKNTYLFLRSVFVPGLVVEKLRVDDRKFAFGICIAISTALWMYLRHEGRL